MKINRSILRQAVSDRVKSMMRKWPAIFLVAAACLGLYYLDHAKQSFDEEKARPLLVDEKFKQRLKQQFPNVGGNTDEWDKIEKFIPVTQYSTADDFINKVVARISLANEANEFVAQAQFRGCVARSLAPPAEALPDSGAAAVKSAEDCSTNYTNSDAGFYRDTQDKIAIVYHYLKKAPLKKIAAELAGEQEKKGYFEALLQPTLDDRSGLHIIYQIVRVSLVVIIAFALIAVVALLLGAMMLSDGVKTVTDQATSFIGGGKGTLLPIGKAAGITVAALGLGTAVAAGVAMNNQSNQPMVQRENPVQESRNRTGNDAKGKNSSSVRTTNHDSTNTVYASGDTNTFYDYPDNQDSERPLDLPFVVQVYPRLKVIESGPGGDNGSNTGKVALDDSLVQSMKSYLDGLTAVNRDLSLKIGALIAPADKDEIKVANHVTKTNSEKPLLIDLVPESTQLISTSIKGLDAQMTSVKELITKLDRLHDVNLDKPAYPSERSGIKAIFGGRSLYFVSRRAVDQLEDLIKGAAAYYTAEKLKVDSTIAADYDQKLKADAAISQALKQLYLSGGKPVEKEAFLAQLERELRLTDNFTQNEPFVMGRYKFWRDTILTYTRVR
jgi:hypothetical protein